MDLGTFLYNLHFDIDKAKPVDWKVDWEDAPLTYKLYRGLPGVPFAPEVPLTLEEREVLGEPDLRQIGHFLWYVFGLTQFSQSIYDWAPMEQPLGLMQSYRRFAPSGGGLYPNELYVYLKLKDLPVGVYHYDVAHHRLVLLREGDFDFYLTQALGNRCKMSACFGTVFVSTMFWKNFYKYHNFAYRLQGLDAGVLIGQMLEVAKRFGYKTGVYFQFLDRAANHLLGLSTQEESVYAVIPLTLDPAINWFDNGNEADEMVSATELCRELTPIKHDHYMRSRKVLEYPMLIRMNEASLQEARRSIRQIEGEKKNKDEGTSVTLPHIKRLSYDLATVCRKRYSPGNDFVLGNVSQMQLATLLQAATASFLYRNDLNGAEAENQSHVTLYGCFYGVEGTPNGAYRYDTCSHTLRLVRVGDHRHWLQQGMSLNNVNLFQVPLCFHVIGQKDHLKQSLGYRGYRIQQMEAGMLVQSLLLTASAIGMGGHAILGFDPITCDELYNIDAQGQTSLIQIPIGYYRPRSRLEGGLHG